MGMKKTVVAPPARPRDARGRLLPQKEVAKIKTPREAFMDQMVGGGTTTAADDAAVRGVPLAFAADAVARVMAPLETPAGVPTEEVIPQDATCVAASPQSGHRYFPCGAPAVAINTDQDHVRGARCFAHAIVGVKEYGEHIVVTSHPTLLALKEVTG